MGMASRNASIVYCLIDPLSCHEGVGKLSSLWVCLIESSIVRVWVVEKNQNLKCMESEASMENLSNWHLLIKNYVLIEALFFPLRYLTWQCNTHSYKDIIIFSFCDENWGKYKIGVGPCKGRMGLRGLETLFASWYIYLWKMLLKLLYEEMVKDEYKIYKENIMVMRKEWQCLFLQVLWLCDIFLFKKFYNVLWFLFLFYRNIH